MRQASLSSPVQEISLPTLRRLVSISVAFSAMACAADPALLNLVMPEARVLFGVNVARIVQSPIGKSMGSQLQRMNPEVQRILSQTGFDPARDLEEILIAATGEGNKGTALILARGK